MEDRYGNCILLGFEERFGDSAGRVASTDGAWHLRDHNFGQFEFVMMAGIGCQRFRNLFGGCDCYIRCNASSCRARIVEIEEAPREVCAVIRKQIEVALVSPVVVFGNQAVILFFSRSNFEAVDLANDRRLPIVAATRSWCHIP